MGLSAVFFAVMALTSAFLPASELEEQGFYDDRYCGSLFIRPKAPPALASKGPPVKTLPHTEAAGLPYDAFAIYSYAYRLHSRNGSMILFLDEHQAYRITRILRNASDGYPFLVKFKRTAAADGTDLFIAECIRPLGFRKRR